MVATRSPEMPWVVTAMVSGPAVMRTQGTPETPTAVSLTIVVGRSPTLMTLVSLFDISRTYNLLSLIDAGGNAGTSTSGDATGGSADR